MTVKDILIRMVARVGEGGMQVRAQLTHPMDSGLPGQVIQGRVQTFDRYLSEGGAAVSPTGRQTLSPPHYLTEVRLEINGEPAIIVYVGPAVSQDPLFGWRIPHGRTGDRVRLIWRNNLGETGHAEAIAQ